MHKTFRVCDDGEDVSVFRSTFVPSSNTYIAASEAQLCLFDVKGIKPPQSHTALIAAPSDNNGVHLVGVNKKWMVVGCRNELYYQYMTGVAEFRRFMHDNDAPVSGIGCLDAGVVFSVQKDKESPVFVRFSEETKEIEEYKPLNIPMHSYCAWLVSDGKNRIAFQDARSPHLQIYDVRAGTNTIIQNVGRVNVNVREHPFVTPCFSKNGKFLAISGCVAPHLPVIHMKMGSNTILELKSKRLQGSYAECVAFDTGNIFALATTTQSLIVWKLSDQEIYFECDLEEFDIVAAKALSTVPRQSVTDHLIVAIIDDRGEAHLIDISTKHSKSEYSKKESLKQDIEDLMDPDEETGERERMKALDDESDDESDIEAAHQAVSRTYQVDHIQATGQATFQVASEPLDKSKTCVLCVNEHGVLRREQGGTSARFSPHVQNAPTPITNISSGGDGELILGCVCEIGILYVVERQYNESDEYEHIVCFEPFSRSRTSWHYKLLNRKERALCCAMGSRMATVVTSMGLVRCFAAGGMQLPIITLMGAPVTCVALVDTAAILTDQNVMIITPSRLGQVNVVPAPYDGVSNCRWFGFNKKGYLFFLNDRGCLHQLKGTHWTCMATVGSAMYVFAIVGGEMHYELTDEASGMPVFPKDIKVKRINIRLQNPLLGSHKNPEEMEMHNQLLMGLSLHQTSLDMLGKRRLSKDMIARLIQRDSELDSYTVRIISNLVASVQGAKVTREVKLRWRVLDYCQLLRLRKSLLTVRIKCEAEGFSEIARDIENMERSVFPQTQDVSISEMFLKNKSLANVDQFLSVKKQTPKKVNFGAAVLQNTPASLSMSFPEEDSDEKSEEEMEELPIESPSIEERKRTQAAPAQSSPIRKLQKVSAVKVVSLGSGSPKKPSKSGKKSSRRFI
ncbi:hypothetical protein PCE1_004050 [Barthelona sp. PCE]